MGAGGSCFHERISEPNEHTLEESARVVLMSHKAAH